MKKLKGIVLDRDGTIIEHIHYLDDPAKVKLNLDINYFFEWTVKNKLKVFIHSNQSGVVRNYFSFNDLMQVHLTMLEKLKFSNFFKVFYAIDFKSKYRKPKSILKKLKSFNINKASEIIYIGDSDVDFETAQNIGSDCYLLNTGLNVPKNKKMYNSYKEIINNIKKNYII